MLRTSVDVYAFGIILVEIFAEVSPQLARADYVNLLKERPKIPQTIELIALGCLEEMPSIRPSFRKIMERLQFQKENILKGAPMLDENMASGSVEGGNSRRPRHNRDAESNNNNNSNENEDGETPTVGGNSRSRVRSNPNHVRSHTSSRSAAASIIKKRWCDFCYSFGENSNGRKTFWSKQKLLLAIFLVILVIIATIVGALSKIGMSGSGAVGGGSSQLSSASSTPTSS